MSELVEEIENANLVEALTKLARDFIGLGIVCMGAALFLSRKGKIRESSD